MNTDKIVVFTGGFDPIHSGHIEAIKEANQLGKVIIGLNSDEWLTRKKGRPFMPFAERKAIIDQFKNVECVIGFDDSDNSASDAIRKAKELYPNSTIVFVNGGDRTATNIPEMDAFEDDQSVEFVFSVGGDYKKNSSSWILQSWAAPEESRVWGKFFTYYTSRESKVKRLVIAPGKSISMQYHKNRSEFWFVESGVGTLKTLVDNVEISLKDLKKHDTYYVERGQWHRIENTGREDLYIIEIQYGSSCTEEDIVRK